MVEIIILIIGGIGVFFTFMFGILLAIVEFTIELIIEFKYFILVLICFLAILLFVFNDTNFVKSIFAKFNFYY